MYTESNIKSHRKLLFESQNIYYCLISAIREYICKCEIPRGLASTFMVINLLMFCYPDAISKSRNIGHFASIL